MNTATITSPDTHDDVRTTVARNFSAALEDQRWSERKAAKALGLTPAYINRRTTGETEMSASDLALFAGFLDMRVQDFFRKITNGSFASDHLAPVTPIRKAVA